MKWHVSRGFIVTCVLTLAGIAGLIVSSGCGDVTTTQQEPGTSPTPTSPPATAKGKDAIDPTKIVWHITDPSQWKALDSINFSVTSIVRPAKPTISWQSTLPSYWPLDTTKNPVTVGVLWVIAKTDGQTWNATPIEWILQKQMFSSTMENIPPQPPFIQGKAAPFQTYRPESGEKLGFMISTLPAQYGAAANTPNERSWIVVHNYP